MGQCYHSSPQYIRMGTNNNLWMMRDASSYTILFNNYIISSDSNYNYIYIETLLYIYYFISLLYYNMTNILIIMQCVYINHVMY